MLKTTTATLLLIAFILPCSFRDHTTFPYKSVRIGELTWMAENLRETTFRNGETITQAKSQKEWDKLSAAGKPAWCYYNFEAKYGKIYGLLYNWYAVNDPRGLAPAGWHVATQKEWEQFYALGDQNGIPLKSKEGWSKGGNGTNSSGFNALPGGMLNLQLGEYGYWWTATKDENEKDGSYMYFLVNNEVYLDFRTYGWHEGLSVRCVKDSISTQ